MITEAHRLDELQAEFIATASELGLRSPLSRRSADAATPRLRSTRRGARFISLIVDESERLGRIVNQILLANQLDVGRLDLMTEPFEAAELLQRVTESARTRADITLAVAVGDGVPSVAADKDRVRQILVNLVENGIKYSPDGGTIELGVEATDESMVLFRDEGMGIPEDERPRIFQKFYRLDPDMTRGIGGTGLGLYICSSSSSGWAAGSGSSRARARAPRSTSSCRAPVFGPRGRDVRSRPHKPLSPRRIPEEAHARSARRTTPFRDSRVAGSAAADPQLRTKTGRGRPPGILAPRNPHSRIRNCGQRQGRGRPL